MTDQDEIDFCVFWLAEEFSERQELKYSDLLEWAEEAEDMPPCYLMDAVLAYWESKLLIETETLPDACQDEVHHDFLIRALVSPGSLRSSRPDKPIEHGNPNPPRPRGMKNC